MRTLLALLLLALSARGNACSCFPPELRAKTAQEALEKSRLAVFGRVLEVDSDGRARLLVLESFKGPAGGTLIDAGPGAGLCVASSFIPGEEVLLLVFDDAAAGCSQYAPGHFLLEGFRSNAAQGR